MAGQKGGFAELLCDCPATLRDLFRFLLFFSPVHLVKMAFFFFCFFVLKIIFERELRILTNGQLSKQRLVLIVVDFLNQLSELLKVIFDNIVQIRINR